MGEPRDAPGHPKYQIRLKKNSKWRANNPGYHRNSYLQRYYGITLEEYNNIFSSQNLSCAICHTENSTGKGFHVDHCHTTKRVRGILCHSCNLGLGQFKDDPNLLVKAASYLIGG